MLQHRRGLPNFVKARHQARLQVALENPRVGRKYRLAHRANELFRNEVATALPRSLSHAQIEDQLSRRGAPEECCVFVDRDMTPVMCTLSVAVRKLVFSDDAAVISCIPGVLGLFTDEAPADQWILDTRIGPESG